MQVEKEITKPKVLDLVDKSDLLRKNLNGQGEAYGNEILGDRKIYILVEIKKEIPEGAAQEEEVAKNVVIDGSCMRTPEEDKIFDEEQKEIEAAAAKKGPKGKGGKKWNYNLSVVYFKQSNFYKLSSSNLILSTRRAGTALPHCSCTDECWGLAEGVF